MAGEATEQVEVQDDAQALASAMAGYNNTARGEQPPAEVSTEPSAEPELNPVIAAEPTQPEPAPAPDPSGADDLKAQLTALKAQVSALASTSDPESVRKMHGEIGNINRTLKQLQAQPEPAPVEDELTAALKAADAAADEFPELVGPLVKAIRLLKSTKQEPVEPATNDIDSRVAAKVTAIRQDEAVEQLAEDHPDFRAVRTTPEFKTWLSSKTPEFQQRMNTTWNPAVISKGLTEFKETLKAKQKKQDRLAAAVTPQGVSQKAGPSTLPDEAGFSVGYNKGRKRL